MHSKMNLEKSAEEREIHFKIRSQLTNMKDSVNITQHILFKTFQESVISVIKTGSIDDDLALQTKIRESVGHLRALSTDFDRPFRDEITKSAVFLGIADRYVEDIVKI